LFLVSWFKSNILTVIPCETTKKNKDNSNTDNSSCYRSIPFSECPRYPDLYQSSYKNQYEYSGHSKNSWNSSNNPRNSDCTYSIADSVQFFILEERKHYNRLSKYVLEPLSELDLKYFHIKYEHDENVIPIYHNIPLYSHYDEAILHMKKDKENCICG
jgi:hypothetical protein